MNSLGAWQDFLDAYRVQIKIEPLLDVLARSRASNTEELLLFLVKENYPSHQLLTSQLSKKQMRRLMKPLVGKISNTIKAVYSPLLDGTYLKESSIRKTIYTDSIE